MCPLSSLLNWTGRSQKFSVRLAQMSVPSAFLPFSPFEASTPSPSENNQLSDASQPLTIYLLLSWFFQERDGRRLAAAGFSHKRNPPRKALRLSPARQRGGSSFNLETFPPPSTISSGSRAAVRREMTSFTHFLHFFFPYFFSARKPT